MGTEFHTDWLDIRRADKPAKKSRESADSVQGGSGKFSDVKTSAIPTFLDLRDENTRAKDFGRIRKGDE